jgi:hypothetical protein
MRSIEDLVSLDLEVPEEVVRAYRLLLLTIFAS